jgi:putative membrane protein
MSKGLLISMAAGGLLASVVAMPVHAQAKPAVKADTHATKVKANVKEDVREDQAFIRELASDNLLEIRLGELAQRKATDPEAKQYGQRMVTDHTKANQELLNVASRGGLTFKPGLGHRHEAKIDRLQKVDKKGFDRAYATMMIQNHNDDVSYLENEGRSAHSAPVRNYASGTLPMFQEHLNMAKRLAIKVGADTTGVTNAAHASIKK